jgi:heme oxygenase
MNQFHDTARESDVLTALRQATAARHERLDSGLPLSAPDATLADYAAHLQLLRAWLAPLQGWLAGFGDGPQGPSGLPAAPHLALIDADLADPALADHAAPVTAGAAHWPAGAGAAYRWGVAYVVEGSEEVAEACAGACDAFDRILGLAFEEG